MKILFVILLLISGCAPSYITQHGIKIYDKTVINTPSINSVENIIDYTIKKLNGKDILYGTRVMFVNKWIQIPIYKKPGKVALADGYTNIWKKEIIVSIFQSCIADSGLIHELAHIIHDYGIQIPDWWHDDKNFWSMIKDFEAQAIKDICPKEFKHVKISKDYTVN